MKSCVIHAILRFLKLKHSKNAHVVNLLPLLPQEIHEDLAVLAVPVLMKSLMVQLDQVDLAFQQDQVFLDVPQIQADP